MPLSKERIAELLQEALYAKSHASGTVRIPADELITLLTPEVAPVAEHGDVIAQAAAEVEPENKPAAEEEPAEGGEPKPVIN